MRSLLPTPPRFAENGQVAAYGLFEAPFRDLNILETKIPGVPAGLRKFRIKEWQHFAVVTEAVLLDFVVNTTHYMGTSFCYVLDRENNVCHEHHRERLGDGTKVARELWHDDCLFIKGAYRIHIENRLENGKHFIHIDVPAKGGTPAIKAELTLTEDLAATQPLEVALPISKNRPLYTHKMIVPAEGDIYVGERHIALDPARDLALIDVQKTYYPYNTLWRWAAGAGFSTGGAQVGFNLVHNMIEDDERYNENVMWIDGALTPLGAARFEFDMGDCLKPWRVRTSDGRLDLNFTPAGQRAERINALVIMSDYHQPYGTYSGTLIDKDNQTHDIAGLFGVTEYHKARF